MIAVIGVDYEEGDLSSYKGMYVNYHGKEIFRSKVERGDHPIVADIMACTNFCIKNHLKIYWSSSADTFQMERHQDYLRRL